MTRSVVLACLGGAQASVFWWSGPNEFPGIFVYPLAGLAAVLGAWWIAVSAD